MSDGGIKKNIMYIPSEDFYIFCYLIFIILKKLDCKGDSYFKDYKKLGFLIGVVRDEEVLYILENSKRDKNNPVDKETLFNSFTEGLLKKNEVLKLLFALEKRGYVKLQRRNNSTEIDVSLLEENIPSGFFSKDVFASEFNNISILMKVVKRLKALTLDTMLSKLYVENGVKVWAI